MDRLGDTFRWKSENVSTAEVSEVLGLFPGIIEANVYGVEVPGHDGRAGCAALYLDPAVSGTFDFNALLKHCRAKLPKYAVPVFVRVLGSFTTMHNNKQNKVPLRNDGIDLRKVGERAEKEARERGEKVEGGEVVVDKFYWCPYALGHPRVAGMEDEEGYVSYGMEDWDGLREAALKGGARL